MLVGSSVGYALVDENVGAGFGRSVCRLIGGYAGWLGGWVFGVR